MTYFEKKINAFAVRHGINFGWQKMRAGYVRAKIAAMDRRHMDEIEKAARRLKGVKVDSWTCSDGGFFEGYIYLTDAATYEIAHAAAEKEAARNRAWCQVYHDCLVSGMDCAAAMAQAEKLYPTPNVA